MNGVARIVWIFTPRLYNARRKLIGPFNPPAERRRKRNGAQITVPIIIIKVYTSV